MNCNCGWDSELDDDPYLTVVCCDFYPAALLMPQYCHQWQLTLRIIDTRRDTVAFWRLPQNWCVVQL